jgi:hypothetical protein
LPESSAASASAGTSARKLSLGSRLGVQRVEREAVDRMTPDQRMRVYQAGRLSGYQLGHWAASHPGEIPPIDGAPEWIASTLVNVIETSNPSPRLRELQQARHRARAAAPVSRGRNVRPASFPSGA